MNDRAASKIIPWIIAIGMFMEFLDVSIITTAIPSMAESFKINPIDLKFALTSYLLSLALFIPISGFVADRWGTQRTFIAALFLFTLSSVGCGSAHSLSELVIARILQGMGGAFMMPVGQLIVMRAFPKSDIVRVRTFISMPGLFGPLLGPVIGGFITTYYTWPWIFYINVPVGILGILFSLRYIKNYTHEAKAPFDWIGFLLFGFSLAGSFFVIESIHQPFIPNFVVVLFALASAIGFYCYFQHYKKKENPVLRLKLFLKRTFSVAALGNFLTRPGVSSVFFLFPLLLQIGYGLSPLVSGLLICSRPLGMLMTKTIGRHLLHRLGFRTLLITSSLLSALSIFSFALIEKVDITLIITLGILNGMIISPLFTGLSNLYYADITTPDASQTTSISSTIQQFSTGLGVTFCALILEFFNGWNKPLKLDDPIPFQWTFVIVGALALLSVPIFFKLKPSDGRGMI